MYVYRRIRTLLNFYVENVRLRLARQEALLELTLLGALAGLVAGAGMVVFRLLIGISPPLLLGADNPQNFEYLDPWLRVLLPTAGALVVALLLHRVDSATREVGIVHVMHGLSYREGHLPIKNAGVQFVTAVLCILSGQSVGREGPSVHVGAACGSWTGQRLQLPNNSIRVLVGCGSAGAISAAFNTPLAGVIFAMEVVLLEYTLASFIPIILAAVSAATLARWVFGPAPIFVIPRVELGTLGDLASVVLMGVVIGLLASVFVRTLMFISTRWAENQLWLRLTVAGICTGLLGLVVPEVMGIGYDTVNHALLGELSLSLMLALLACKLLATALALGLGLPGGVIGPTLVMGAVAGGAVGYISNVVIPGATAHAFFAMLGMAAMMAAVLNAPLAALIALLELTANPHVILPGMFAVVVACIVTQQICRTPSIFVSLLQARGLDYSTHPLSQFLRGLGVVPAMNRNVLEVTRPVDEDQLVQLRAAPPTWLLTRGAESDVQILFGADLIRYLENNDVDTPFKLSELPIDRRKAAPLSSQATLWGALRMMNREQVDALYIVSRSRRVLGIVTRQIIENTYRNPTQ